MLDRPIFILGCGRSGTTTLGTSVGRHSQIAYLNEPREYWFKAFPQSDVWTSLAQARRGRIVLEESDWTQDGADRLVKSFAASLAQQKRQRLCEKLPINNFRIGLIERVFPDALFIYIEREPIAVARSIEQMDRTARWFSGNLYRWDKLVRLAADNPRLNGLAGRCVTSFQKGVLEWVLSTSFAKRSLTKLPAQRVMRTTYAQFTGDPAGTLVRVEKFAGLCHDAEAGREAAAMVRPAPAVPPHPADPLIHALLAAAATDQG